MCSLNVCGLISKLDNGYFDKFCFDYDVICLSETKCAKHAYDLNDSLLYDYDLFLSDKETNDEVFAIYGLCILIRKSFSKYFKLVKKYLKQACFMVKSR